MTSSKLAYFSKIVYNVIVPVLLEMETEDESSPQFPNQTAVGLYLAGLSDDQYIQLANEVLTPGCRPVLVPVLQAPISALPIEAVEKMVQSMSDASEIYQTYPLEIYRYLRSLRWAQVEVLRRVHTRGGL